MIIALDLDDTLAKSIDGFLDFYNKKFNSSLSLKDFTSYTLHEILDMPKDEEDKIMEEFDNSNYNKNLLPIKEAVRVVNKLSKTYKFIIITSRLKKYEQETRDWIKIYFPSIKEIIFIRRVYQKNVKSKGEVCKEIGAELLIDDNLDHVLDCSRLGIKAILIEYPWNKGKVVGKLVTKVKTWKEIEEILSKK